MWHIYVSKLTIIASDNGLLPNWRQTIISTNAQILLIGPLGTNFSEILIKNLYVFIQENAFEYVVWNLAAILSQPQCVNQVMYFPRQHPPSMSNAMEGELQIYSIYTAPKKF